MSELVPAKWKFTLRLASGSFALLRVPGEEPREEGEEAKLCIGAFTSEDRAKAFAGQVEGGATVELVTSRLAVLAEAHAACAVVVWLGPPVGAPAIDAQRVYHLDDLLMAEIERYFDECLFGYVCGDIERSIVCARANFLVALGLLCYTELLGGLDSGDLGLRTKSESNFNAGLALFEWQKDSNYYKDFTVDLADEGNTETVGLYKLFRCGMVHEYFSKGFAIIHNNPSHAGACVPEDAGIGWITDNGRRVLRFHTNAYFRDFRGALGKLREAVRTDGARRENFLQAVRRVEGRRVAEIER